MTEGVLTRILGCHVGRPATGNRVSPTRSCYREEVGVPEGRSITELELTFAAGGATETHVRLEHRNLERFGPSEGQLRGMFDAPEGWTSTLADFARAAEG